MLANAKLDRKPYVGKLTSFFGAISSLSQLAKWNTDPTFFCQETLSAPQKCAHWLLILQQARYVAGAVEYPMNQDRSALDLVKEQIVPDYQDSIF